MSVEGKHGTKKPEQILSAPAFLCRDDPTRTDDPYVPNVVRYQLRYIPIAAQKAAFGRLPFVDCLCEFVDVNCDTALEVCCLVLVNDTDLREFVNHCIDLWSTCLSG